MSALIWLSVAACFVIACAFDRIDFLALGVGLVAVALVVSYLDMGVFDRLVAFSSYSHHNNALSLLRSYFGKMCIRDRYKGWVSAPLSIVRQKKEILPVGF